ncbi:hypothetical protein BDV30DRAFT_187709 [Aspergillus minisclerotigenes]|uniref:Zn(2)-C6 fungal-type domain-containing protein n=1 Tax=Aspergillus minisclerotigenes TaxID=656917 RepID=A0A5N6IUF3_9EURO|nr:hypothetical protein BDV30DRAFT_187709 [Aspergillus minisclerotigenes]
MTGGTESPRSGMLPSRAQKPPKKYVTRACDECKRRKCKCDGLEPCYRCVSMGLDCAYHSSYNRVQKRKRHVSIPLLEYSLVICVGFANSPS